MTDALLAPPHPDLVGITASEVAAPTVGLNVLTIAGQPSFAAVEELEREMRVEAGMPADPVTFTRTSPTAFHVVLDVDGRCLGVASTTVGDLAELPIGHALRAEGVDLGAEPPLVGPVCELVSIAVAPSAETTGVTEVLYRACYRRARMMGAANLAVALEPWLLDILQERYGVPFAAIGPILSYGGRDLLPVGGRLDDLVYGVGATRPHFLQFLEEGLALRDPEAATLS